MSIYCPIHLHPPSIRFSGGKLRSRTSCMIHSSIRVAKRIIILHSKPHSIGSAFPQKERDLLCIHGLLPPRIESMSVQSQRALHQLRNFNTNMEKHIYLCSLKSRNETLFYNVLVNNLQELLPIVYTPTVRMGPFPLALDDAIGLAFLFPPLLRQINSLGWRSLHQIWTELQNG